jgi:nicotinate-nucleotide adenylyltransferase
MGGTFDPIHVAHLIIAEEVCDVLGLSQMVFIPAARPPHKSPGSVSPVARRLEMVRLAVADNPRLAFSDFEARRDEPSYTIETIRHFRAELGPDETIYFVIGADGLVQFPSWREPFELLSTCEIVVVPRPGIRIEDSDPRIRDRALVLSTPLFEVSSSDIRERVRAGRSIRYLVPPTVRAYIREKKLYT